MVNGAAPCATAAWRCSLRDLICVGHPLAFWLCGRLPPPAAVPVRGDLFLLSKKATSGIIANRCARHFRSVWQKIVYVQQNTLNIYALAASDSEVLATK